MISVIVPTFNEEENICDLIRYIKSCPNGNMVEIIVSDAPGSTDKGCVKAGGLGVKALTSPRASRAFQMNYGAKQAKNEVLYFLHADARPPLNFVEQILDALEKVEFGIFAYKFKSKSLMLKMNAYFTRFDGLFAGGGDQSFFIKKDAFQAIGGFNEDLRIMEDFDIFRRAKRSGRRFTIIKDPLLVSARKYEKNSWLKVNLINLSIFFLFLVNGSQDRMIALNRRLSS